MTPEDARTRLIARQKELTEGLNRIEEELEEPVEKDWEEAAVERQNDEVLQALGQQDQHELRRIEAALQRIDEGEYGFCVTCGRDIAPERLDLLPDTPFCAQHAV